MKKVTKKKYSNKFLQNLQPDFIVEDVTQIDEALLISFGIKAIAFDADSTLVEHNSLAISPEALLFLESLTLPIYLTTNRPAPRGDSLGKIIGVKKVIHASRKFRKPQAAYFKELLSHSKIDLDKTVLVGDRLFTDILGGNRSGLTTIYTKALGKDPKYIRYSGLRYVENAIISFLTIKS